MKKLLISFIVFSFSMNAFGFSREEHVAITKFAAKQLNECIRGGKSAVKTWLLESSIEKMASSNAFEDVAVWKKWTVASHFYNPVKRLEWGQNEPTHRGDADDAVKRALGKYLDESAEGKEDGFKRIGQMLHYIQDASSPLHVIGINHNLGDGFENNAEVTAMAEALATKIPCARVNDTREPLTILQMNATQTLKITDQHFNYRLGGENRDRQAKWSEVFYVNKALASDKLSALLKRFDPLGKMFEIKSIEIPAANLDSLPRGGYGVFADAHGLISKKDNFGKTDFEVASGSSVRKVHIERAEYIAFKKKLILEAVQASQETIVWSLMNQRGAEDLAY